MFTLFINLSTENSEPNTMYQFQYPEILSGQDVDKQEEYIGISILNLLIFRKFLRRFSDPDYLLISKVFNVFFKTFWIVFNNFQSKLFYFEFYKQKTCAIIIQLFRNAKKNSGISKNNRKIVIYRKYLLRTCKNKQQSEINVFRKILDGKYC